MNFKNVFIVATILVMISACSSNNSSSNKNDQQTNKSTEDAKDLFESKCAVCHGSYGTAGIGNAANLQTSRLDSASIVHIINEGKSAMPSFKSQLAGAEINKIAIYVRSLQQ
jgi:mono/diheme cytochrome c family protein